MDNDEREKIYLEEYDRLSSPDYEKGRVEALNVITQLGECDESDEVLSGFAQMIISGAVKILNAIEGVEFKNDFLQHALEDEEQLIRKGKLNG